VSTILHQTAARAATTIDLSTSSTRSPWSCEQWCAVAAQATGKK
jgi:hypothetical protein